MITANPQEFPSATYLGEFPPDSPEWHELRSQGLGGSEIGTIMGLNPWESAYTLWAKKTGRIPTPKLDNWSVRLGKAFETPILELFKEQHPELEIYLAGTYASKEMSFMHANPDAMAYDPANKEWIVIEVKTARNPWNSVPAHYVAQVLHYMDVMNVKKSILVAVAGMDYKEWEIPADPFQQSAQRDAGIRFWQSLQTEDAPDWDGSDSTYQTMRQINPEIENVEIEIGELGIGLWNAQMRADKALAELNQFKSATLAAMGSAKHATVTVDGEPKSKIASRQMRGGSPSLIVHRKAN